jgi:hypothetical protein
MSVEQVVYGIEASKKHVADMRDFGMASHDTLTAPMHAATHAIRESLGALIVNLMRMKGISGRADTDTQGNKAAVSLTYRMMTEAAAGERIIQGILKGADMQNEHVTGMLADVAKGLTAANEQNDYLAAMDDRLGRALAGLTAAGQALREYDEYRQVAASRAESVIEVGNSFAAHADAYTAHITGSA